MATATPTPATPAAAPAAVSEPTPEQIAAAAAAEARLQALLAMGDVSQANAATGIVGDSGSGKSTLAATAAEYCWNRYHKISRYVAADLGGFGNKLLRLIRLQIVQVYNPSNHVEPFETMELLSLGYWPEKVDDPFTGYAQPDVKLVAPQETRWNVRCAQDHIVRTLNDKRALNGFSVQCSVCKGAPVTPQTLGRVEEVTTRSPWIKHVGLYIYDSGTSLSDWAMEDMANRAARNDNLSDGNALTKTGAKVVSGTMAFGANQPAHYGFAQNRVRAWIKNSRTIPGQVVPPIWTFLELRATDDDKRISIFGPKIAGNAKTGDVPAWLGNCLHAAKERNDRGVEVHRLWLVTHTDPGGVAPHLAKTRAEPGTMPPFLEDGPDEPPFSKFSLGYFFDQLEMSLDAASRRDAQEFADAPAFTPLNIGTEQEVVSTRDLSGKDTGVRQAPGRTQVQAPGATQAARPATAPQAAQVRPAAQAAPAAARAVVAAPATQAARPAQPASVAPPAPPAQTAQPAQVRPPAQAQGPVAPVIKPVQPAAPAAAAAHPVSAPPAATPAPPVGQPTSPTTQAAQAQAPAPQAAAVPRPPRPPATAPRVAGSGRPPVAPPGTKPQ